MALFIEALRQVGRLPKLNFIVFGGDQIQRARMPGIAHRLPDLARADQRALLSSSGNAEVRLLPVRSPERRLPQGMERQGTPVPAGHRGPSIPRRAYGSSASDATVDGRPYGEAAPGGLRWLERELAATGTRGSSLSPCIISCCPRRRRPDARWPSDGKNHAAVRGLLDRFPECTAVISGHHHALPRGDRGQDHPRCRPRHRNLSLRVPGVHHRPRRDTHLQNIGLDDKTLVSRARELLIADPFAGMYDAENPQNVLSYTVGLREQDRGGGHSAVILS